MAPGSNALSVLLHKFVVIAALATGSGGAQAANGATPAGDGTNAESEFSSITGTPLRGALIDTTDADAKSVSDSTAGGTNGVEIKVTGAGNTKVGGDANERRGQATPGSDAARVLANAHLLSASWELIDGALSRTNTLSQTVDVDTHLTRFIGPPNPDFGLYANLGPHHGGWIANASVSRFGFAGPGAETPFYGAFNAWTNSVYAFDVVVRHGVFRLTVRLAIPS